MTQIPDFSYSLNQPLPTAGPEPKESFAKLVMHQNIDDWIDCTVGEVEDLVQIRNCQADWCNETCVLQSKQELACHIAETEPTYHHHQYDGHLLSDFCLMACFGCIFCLDLIGF